MAYPTSTNASGIWKLNEVSRALLGGDWPQVFAWKTDSNAANLWTAIPFTTTSSSFTGGGYVDVSPLIRANQSLTPGSARVLTNTGNGSFTSNVSAPTGSFLTDTLEFATASSTTHLIYYGSTALNCTGNLTIETWVYMPSSNANGYGILATNDFSGGYYQGWSTSVNTSNNPSFYSNYSTTLTGTGGNVSRDSWHHLAYVFTSGNLKMFVDGTQVASGTGQGANSQSTVAIGGTSWDGFGSSRAGLRMTNFRVYTIAKYSSSFTVDPTDPDLGGFMF